MKYESYKVYKLILQIDGYGGKYRRIFYFSTYLDAKRYGIMYKEDHTRVQIKAIKEINVYKESVQSQVGMRKSTKGMKRRNRIIKMCGKWL